MRLFTTLLAAALLAGCRSLPNLIKTVEDINLEVNPSPVVLQGDEVTKMTYRHIPPKYFAKKTVAATPVLVWDGGEAAFQETANYQGEEAAGNGTVVSWENGKSSPTRPRFLRELA